MQILDITGDIVVDSQGESGLARFARAAARPRARLLRLRAGHSYPALARIWHTLVWMRLTPAAPRPSRYGATSPWLADATPSPIGTGAPNP